VFMAAAFITVARADLLHPLEIAGVLGRDIVAALGYVGAWLLRHPMTLPARAGGKAVTVLQLLTLVACIVRSPHVRSIAWATAAASAWWDTIAAAPIPIARTCGSMWSWASSCTIAPRSTGCSSTTAWMGSATTGCTPA